MPDLPLTDTTIHYAAWGTGEPVVFVHSWALCGDQWSYLVPDIAAAGHCCLTYDQRGHGRSDRPPSGYDFDTFADDLASLIDQLGLDGVTLVGHSMGCGEIVRYLTRHGSDRVARIVLLAPTMPHLLATDDDPLGIPAEALDANIEQLRDDVPRWCADNAAPFFGVDPTVSDGMFDWVIRQIVDTPSPILVETMRVNTVEDFRAELAQVDVPTLIVHGDADASAPIDLTGRRVADLVPSARLVVHEGWGHGLYADHHREVAEDILTFTAATAPSPATSASA